MGSGSREVAFRTHSHLSSDNHYNRTAPPLVIVNPRSAGGATRDRWTSIASELSSHLGGFTVAFTESAGHAVRLAKDAASAGQPLIIACGGDGTINETANGIIQAGTDTELAVLPSGTGGDFRRTIGMSSSVREAADAIRRGITKSIDVGRVSYVSHAGSTAERYFLNISSVGLAASVIRRVKSEAAFNWLPVETVRGKANFAVAALREALDPEAFSVSVKFDDQDEFVIRTLCLCVANSRYFGGGMMIAPEARLTDGLLDVVNIGDMTTARILLNALSLYRGTHLSLDEVKARRAEVIEVGPAGTGEVPLEIDGETLGKLPARFEVVPKRIRVRVPRSSQR